MDTTAHDLKVLAIGYYIQAGVLAFYSLFVLGYSAFVVAILNMIQQSPQAGARDIPAWLGPLMSGILLGAFAALLCFALGHFLTGRWLAQHRHRLFCQIIAGISCLGFPYGTALGIFTFFVVNRPEARRLFAAEMPRWEPPTPPPAVPQ